MFETSILLKVGVLFGQVVGMVVLTFGLHPRSPCVTITLIKIHMLRYILVF